MYSQLCYGNSSPFPYRRCLEFACIQGLGAGLPSEPCWCSEAWRLALRWFSLFLWTVCPPEKTGYICWSLSTSTGRYWIVTHRRRGYQSVSCQTPPHKWPLDERHPIWEGFVVSLMSPPGRTFRCLFSLSDNLIVEWFLVFHTSLNNCGWKSTVVLN